MLRRSVVQFSMLSAARCLHGLHLHSAPAARCPVHGLNCTLVHYLLRMYCTPAQSTCAHCSRACAVLHDVLSPSQRLLGPQYVARGPLYELTDSVPAQDVLQLGQRRLIDIIILLLINILRQIRVRQSCLPGTVLRQSTQLHLVQARRP